GRNLALQPCERIFLLGLRMQKNGEFPPHLQVSLALQVLGASPDHHPITFTNRQPEHPVPNRASDQVNSHARMLSHLRLLLALLLLITLSGCGTLYLAQAAGGQYRVLQARRPIDKVVDDPATPATLRDRLTDVRAARKFAVTELHLPDNRSYRTYAD